MHSYFALPNSISCPVKSNVFKPTSILPGKRQQRGGAVRLHSSVDSHLLNIFMVSVLCYGYKCF